MELSKFIRTSNSLDNQNQYLMKEIKIKLKRTYLLQFCQKRQSLMNDMFAIMCLPRIFYRIYPFNFLLFRFVSKENMLSHCKKFESRDFLS